MKIPQNISGSFDEKTEILTSSGWKRHNEISLQDNFATLNINSNRIEFQNANEIYSDKYSGEMLSIESRGVDILATPHHNLYFKYGDGHSEGFFRMGMAKDMRFQSNRVCFKIAGTLGNKKYSSITDDELRICAWIHTDGGIKKDKHYSPCYVLYQRKSKHHLITDILDRLKYKYVVAVRSERNIKIICGKKLKKKPEDSCVIRIHRDRGIGKRGAAHRLDTLIPEKYVLSQWAYKLSDRQFTIFLSSLIDGDGSRHKSCPETSWMLYGMKHFLDQVQMVGVMHGYRCSMTEYRENTWRLNINKTDYVCIDRFRNLNKKIHYNGVVFNVSTPNSTVIVRRNGKVHISGNSSMHDTNELEKQELSTNSYDKKNLYPTSSLRISRTRKYRSE